MPEQDEKPAFPPVCLYHVDEAPEGKVFENQADHDAAVKAGWVDTPAKFPKPKAEGDGKAKK